MRLRAQGEGAVMRGHNEIGVRCLFPEQRGGEVNCVRRTEFGQHRLGGAGEDAGINLDYLEGVDERQDGRAPGGNTRVRKIRSEAQTVQRTEALGRDKGARNAALNFSSAMRTFFIVIL